MALCHGHENFIKFILKCTFLKGSLLYMDKLKKLKMSLQNLGVVLGLGVVFSAVSNACLSNKSSSSFSGLTFVKATEEDDYSTQEKRDAALAKYKREAELKKKNFLETKQSLNGAVKDVSGAVVSFTTFPKGLDDANSGEVGYGRPAYGKTNDSVALGETDVNSYTIPRYIGTTKDSLPGASPEKLKIMTDMFGILLGSGNAKFNFSSVADTASLGGADILSITNVFSTMGALKQKISGNVINNFVHSSFLANENSAGVTYLGDEGLKFVFELYKLVLQPLVRLFHSKFPTNMSKSVKEPEKPMGSNTMIMVEDVVGKELDELFNKKEGDNRLYLTFKTLLGRFANYNSGISEKYNKNRDMSSVFAKLDEDPENEDVIKAKNSVINYFMDAHNYEVEKIGYIIKAFEAVKKSVSDFLTNRMGGNTDENTIFGIAKNAFFKSDALSTGEVQNFNAVAANKIKAFVANIVEFLDISIRSLKMRSESLKLPDDTTFNEELMDILAGVGAIISKDPKQKDNMKKLDDFKKIIKNFAEKENDNLRTTFASTVETQFGNFSAYISGQASGLIGLTLNEAVSRVNSLLNNVLKKLYDCVVLDQSSIGANNSITLGDVFDEFMPFVIEAVAKQASKDKTNYDKWDTDLTVLFSLLADLEKWKPSGEFPVALKKFVTIIVGSVLYYYHNFLCDVVEKIGSALNVLLTNKQLLTSVTFATNVKEPGAFVSGSLPSHSAILLVLRDIVTKNLQGPTYASIENADKKSIIHYVCSLLFSVDETLALLKYPTDDATGLTGDSKAKVEELAKLYESVIKSFADADKKVNEELAKLPAPIQNAKTALDSFRYGPYGQSTSLLAGFGKYLASNYFIKDKIFDKNSNLYKLLSSLSFVKEDYGDDLNGNGVMMIPIGGFVSDAVAYYANANSTELFLSVFDNGALRDEFMNGFFIKKADAKKQPDTITLKVKNVKKEEEEEDEDEGNKVEEYVLNLDELISKGEDTIAKFEFFIAGALSNLLSESFMNVFIGLRDAVPGSGFNYKIEDVDNARNAVRNEIVGAMVEYAGEKLKSGEILVGLSGEDKAGEVPGALSDKIRSLRNTFAQISPLLSYVNDSLVSVKTSYSQARTEVNGKTTQFELLAAYFSEQYDPSSTFCENVAGEVRSAGASVSMSAFSEKNIASSKLDEEED